MRAFALIAAVLFETSQDGVALKVESETAQVDPARSVFLRVELTAAADRTATLPDLRDRVVGFSLAEDFVEKPVHAADGRVVQVAKWRLVPEPCAKACKIRPFVVKASPKMLSYQSDEGKFSLIGGPIAFAPPAAREPVTGGIETDPTKDLPPLSWKLAGGLALAVLGFALIVAGLVALVRLVARKVKEHRMSPIERAWAELDRLVKKGLPGRGRYKDFYVELTMVVRRYIQRKYGVKAPNLTTEEFLRDARVAELSKGRMETLRGFLESADLVKFAGVQATPEMADDATDSARDYLKGDEESGK